MTIKNKTEMILELTAVQQEILTRMYGRQVRRLRIDTVTGKAAAVGDTCSRCLLSNQFFNVTIDENGLCNFCVEFEQEEAAGIYNITNTFDVIQRYKGDSNPDCVVAYSGGKDSAAALLLAIRDFGLKPIAVLVDNGFIPDSVKDASREFCARLNVPFEERPIAIARETSKILQTGEGPIPCQICIKKIFARMAEVCQAHNLGLVIGGHRFPPLTYTLDAFTGNPAHAKFHCVSPLLSRRMPEEEQLKLIKSAGWKEISIAGNTSNCRLIGYVEALHFDRHGVNPNLYEVSREIRAGFYSKEVGLRKVQRPHLDPVHIRAVEERLGIKNSLIN